MQLTEEQREIIEAVGRPLLVLAGPGTGKTEVLARRILFLLRNNLATKKEIVGITFTTKAANQMKGRLKQLGSQEDDQPLICTLHSLAAKILRENEEVTGLPLDFMIADGYEAFLTLQDTIEDINQYLFKNIKRIFSNIFLLKAENINDQILLNKTIDEKICQRYQELLRFHSALDFQDLIIEASRLLETSQEVKNSYQQKFRYLLVDEFQDINRSEYTLIRLLAGNAEGLFVVGDDKQSIYSWRGGNPRIILGFTKDFPQAIQKIMTKCFRCPEKIIRGADKFIKREPLLEPQEKDSEPIFIINCKSDDQEASYISSWVQNVIKNSKYSAKDIAILYRGGDSADKIAESLVNINIPIIRPSSKETRYVKEFIACLRLIVDRDDSLALRVCLASKLAKGIGPKGIKKLLDFSEDNKYSFWNALILANNNSSFKKWHKYIKAFIELLEDLSALASKSKLNKLLYKVAECFGNENESKIIDIIKRSEFIPDNWSLYDFIQDIRGLKGEKSADPRESGEEEVDSTLFITMHSVKGLQKKIIFVIGMEEGNLPQLDGNINEQRRLFYVSMTRAVEKLFLCYAKNRTGRSAQGYRTYKPSPFLFEIPVQYRKFLRPS